MVEMDCTAMSDGHVGDGTLSLEAKTRSLGVGRTAAPSYASTTSVESFIVIRLLHNVPSNQFIPFHFISHKARGTMLTVARIYMPLPTPEQSLVLCLLDKLVMETSLRDLMFALAARTGR
jgi:hypothetical protein